MPVEIRNQKPRSANRIPRPDRRPNPRFSRPIEDRFIDRSQGMGSGPELPLPPDTAALPGQFLQTPRYGKKLLVYGAVGEATGKLIAREVEAFGLEVLSLMIDGRVDIRPYLPLKVKVFPDKQSFLAHDLAQGGKFTGDLQGYFNPANNEVAVHSPDSPDFHATLSHELFHAFFHQMMFRSLPDYRRTRELPQNLLTMITCVRQYFDRRLRASGLTVQDVLETAKTVTQDLTGEASAAQRKRIFQLLDATENYFPSIYALTAAFLGRDSNPFENTPAGGDAPWQDTFKLVNELLAEAYGHYRANPVRLLEADPSFFCLMKILEARLHNLSIDSMSGLQPWFEFFMGEWANDAVALSAVFGLGNLSKNFVGLRSEIASLPDLAHYLSQGRFPLQKYDRLPQLDGLSYLLPSNYCLQCQRVIHEALDRLVAANGPEMSAQSDAAYFEINQTVTEMIFISNLIRHSLGPGTFQFNAPSRELLGARFNFSAERITQFESDIEQLKERLTSIQINTLQGGPI